MPSFSCTPQFQGRVCVGDGEEKLGCPTLLYSPPHLPLSYDKVGAIQGSEAAFSGTTQPRVMAVLGWGRENHKRQMVGRGSRVQDKLFAELQEAKDELVGSR